MMAEICAETCAEPGFGIRKCLEVIKLKILDNMAIPDQDKNLVRDIFRLYKNCWTRFLYEAETEEEIKEVFLKIFSRLTERYVLICPHCTSRNTMIKVSNAEIQNKIYFKGFEFKDNESLDINGNKETIYNEEESYYKCSECLTKYKKSDLDTFEKRTETFEEFIEEFKRVNQAQVLALIEKNIKDKHSLESRFETQKTWDFRTEWVNKGPIRPELKERLLNEVIPAQEEELMQYTSHIYEDYIDEEERFARRTQASMKPM